MALSPRHRLLGLLRHHPDAPLPAVLLEVGVHELQRLAAPALYRASRVPVRGVQGRSTQMKLSEGLDFGARDVLYRWGGGRNESREHV